MTPSEFANLTLDQLNEEFVDDASFMEALEEIITQAQMMLDAKKEELGEEG